MDQSTDIVRLAGLLYLDTNPVASFSIMQQALTTDPYQLTGPKERTFLGHVSSYIIAQMVSEGQMAFIREAFATISFIPSEFTLQTLDVLRANSLIRRNSAYQELETKAEIALLTRPVDDVKTLRSRIDLFRTRLPDVFNEAIVLFDQGLLFYVLDELDTLSLAERELMMKTLHSLKDRPWVSSDAAASVDQILAYVGESIEHIHQ